MSSEVLRLYFAKIKYENNCQTESNFLFSQAIKKRRKLKTQRVFPQKPINKKDYD